MFYGELYFLPLAFSLMLLFCMGLICFNLYFHLNRKTYLYVGLSLIAAMLPFGVIAIQSILQPITMATIGIKLLSTSLILIQGAMYYLFNRNSKKHRFIFTGIVLATGILSFVPHPMFYLIPYVFLIGGTVYGLLKLITDIPTQLTYKVSLLFLALSGITGAAALITELPALIFLYSTFLFLMIVFCFLMLQVHITNRMISASFTSVIDPLTGLFNRRYFSKQVESQEDEEGISIIFCDIDNFKELNDTQGHKAGDEVLINVANIVKEETNNLGLAARYGGEEIVAMIKTKNVNPVDVAQTICRRVEKETRVTVSVGVSVGENGLASYQLIDKADKKMYEAKTSGKNKVCA